MTIFGSKIREELTQILAEHLQTQALQRFTESFNSDDEVTESAAWLRVAEDAIDFVYGEEPADEAPQEPADHWSDHAGCCDIPGGPGFGCPCSTPAVPRRDQNPRLGDWHQCYEGHCDMLTGVVRPPTTPATLLVGQHLYGVDRPSRPGACDPGPESEIGQWVPSPREQGAADE